MSAITNVQRASILTLTALLGAVGCTDSTSAEEACDAGLVATDSSWCAPPRPDIDEDGDGSPASEDCDDTDASIHPGAEEFCDGIDSDCSGGDDAGLLTLVDDATGERTNLASGAGVDLSDDATLAVCAGEHAVAIDTTATLVVNGLHEDAVLTGRGSSVPLTVSRGGALDVFDVTIRDGDSRDNAYDSGGGIHCEESDVYLSGVTIEGGSATSGGNLSTYECDVVIENSLLRDGEANGSGGNVLIYGGELRLVSSRVEGGDAAYGSAIAVQGGGVLVQEDTLIVDARGDSALNLYDGSWYCEGKLGLETGIIGSAGAALSFNSGDTFWTDNCDFGEAASHVNETDIIGPYFDFDDLGNDVELECDGEGIC